MVIERGKKESIAESITPCITTAAAWLTAVAYCYAHCDVGRIGRQIKAWVITVA